jgi:hypothetical protein
MEGGAIGTGERSGPGAVPVTPLVGSAACWFKRWAIRPKPPQRKLAHPLQDCATVCPSIHGRGMLGEASMRTVTIVHDRGDLRPWVAVDCQSGLPVLWLQRREELEALCSRLGWRIKVQGAEPIEKRAAS